jgi:hypothetical protein
MSGTGLWAIFDHDIAVLADGVSHEGEAGAAHRAAADERSNDHQPAVAAAGHNGEKNGLVALACQEMVAPVPEPRTGFEKLIGKCGPLEKAVPIRFEGVEDSAVGKKFETGVYNRGIGLGPGVPKRNTFPF